MSYVVNLATPFLKSFADDFPDQVDHAQKSVAKWLRTEIKTGIKSGAPGGERYKPFRDITMYPLPPPRRDRLKGMLVRRVVSGARRQWKMGKSSRHRPLGKLGNAIGIRAAGMGKSQTAFRNEISVGWLSRTAERAGMIQEKGMEIPITRRMKLFFYAASVGLDPNRATFEIPARPTIGPVFEATRDQIVPRMEKRLMELINR
jgi:hypothetical protein